MNKALLFAILIFLSSNTIIAQDITNKLGGTSANETYDVTDSGNNVLFRVQGDGKVGIGTDSPDANLDLHGTVKAFGEYETKAFNSNFQANTDGFVIAYAFSQDGSGTHAVGLQGFTDNTTTPTTMRVFEISAEVNIGTAVSITMPVRKGDYWRVVALGIIEGSSLSWIPLGQ